MKFALYFAANGNLNEVVTINTMEELKALSQRFDAEVIVNFEENLIWIYDGYME